MQCPSCKRNLVLIPPGCNLTCACGQVHHSPDIAQWIEGEKIAQRQMPGATIPTVTTWNTITPAPELTVAVKNDNEKIDLSLLPRNGKIGIAKAFMYGAKKYKRFNFLKGMEWSRVIAACDRHMTDFNSGIDFDEESKLNHLYHAGACIMMLIEYYERNVGTDDRFKE